MVSYLHTLTFECIGALTISYMQTLCHNRCEMHAKTRFYRNKHPVPEPGDLPKEQVMEAQAERPRTWGECLEKRWYYNCPWVGCRFHLYLDVETRRQSLSIKYNHPTLDVLELASKRGHCCALAAAHDGPNTFEDLSAYLGFTRQAAQLSTNMALKSFKEAVRKC